MMNENEKNEVGSAGRSAYFTEERALCSAWSTPNALSHCIFDEVCPTYLVIESYVGDKEPILKDHHWNLAITVYGSKRLVA
jgi:hypothetical protein